MADNFIGPFNGATTSEFIQNPERGVAHPDTATNGFSVATGETLEIQVEGNDDVEVFMFSTAASTVTFEEGDYPVSQHARPGGAGVEVTIAANAMIPFVPEASRHIRNAGGVAPDDIVLRGSILCTVGGTGPVLFFVRRMRGGFVGVEPTNQRTVPPAPVA